MIRRIHINGPLANPASQRERHVVDDAVAERRCRLRRARRRGARVRAGPAAAREPRERAAVGRDPHGRLVGHVVEQHGATLGRHRDRGDDLAARPRRRTRRCCRPARPPSSRRRSRDPWAGCARARGRRPAPSRKPGRSIASRMSWSWYQQSKTRIAMNWRYGPGPSGVNPSASHCSVRHRAQRVEPAGGDGAELVEQLRAVPAAVRRDPLLVGLADVVAHVRRVAPRRRRGASGCSPASMRSVPIMSATLSNTVQPGTLGRRVPLLGGQAVAHGRRCRSTPLPDRSTSGSVIRARYPRRPRRRGQGVVVGCTRLGLSVDARRRGDADRGRARRRAGRP